MAEILIIDDDEMICDALGSVLRELGHTVRFSLSLERGVAASTAHDFDVIFLDVRLPDGNGLDAIPNLKESPGAPDVIIITGEGDPDGAEMAVKSGAWDYIEKPLSVQEMTLPLMRVLQYREEKEARPTKVPIRREGIVGKGPEMNACYDLLAQAADSEASVIIHGETGTGKELFAKAIHDNSSRKNRPFVVVDCAVLPDTLVESTLFGHEKGAFTSADRSQDGLIRQADGGTLFLDEIGELPLAVQKAFLRVLQERRFRPVGGSREVTSDFRVIAATNRDLEKMAARGQFRQDLLYRLQAILITLPPLRNRKEDIRELLGYYLTKLCDRYGIGTKGVSPEFIESLNAYDWPGNVRELINALEKSIAAVQNGPTLFPMHLPTNIRVNLARSSVSAAPEKEATPTMPKAAAPASLPGASEDFPMLKELVEATEKQYLADLLAITGGDIKETCRISGLSRSRLYDRLKKFGISRRFTTRGY
jgi:two-component system NtrC family response regulator